MYVSGLKLWNQRINNFPVSWDVIPLYFVWNSDWTLDILYPPLYDKEKCIASAFDTLLPTIRMM